MLRELTSNEMSIVSGGQDGHTGSPHINGDGPTTMTNEEFAAHTGSEFFIGQYGSLIQVMPDGSLANVDHLYTSGNPAEVEEPQPEPEDDNQITCRLTRTATVRIRIRGASTSVPIFVPVCKRSGN